MVTLSSQVTLSVRWSHRLGTVRIRLVNMSRVLPAPSLAQRERQPRRATMTDTALAHPRLRAVVTGTVATSGSGRA